MIPSERFLMRVSGNASCEWQWHQHRIWLSDIVYQWSRWCRTAEWCLSVRLQKVCPEGRPGGTSSLPSHVTGSLCWGWAGSGVEFCHSLTVSLGFPGGCRTHLLHILLYWLAPSVSCPSCLLHSKLQRARMWISTFGILPLPYLAQCFIHNWTLFKNSQVLITGTLSKILSTNISTFNTYLWMNVPNKSDIIKRSKISWFSLLKDHDSKHKWMWVNNVLLGQKN